MARITLGADKAYDTADFVAEMRRQGVTPHVARNNKRRRSAIDGRTTRRAGYRANQRLRKRIEEVFGWMFELSAAAYTLIRMPELLGAAA